MPGEVQISYCLKDDRRGRMRGEDQVRVKVLDPAARWSEMCLTALSAERNIL